MRMYSEPPEVLGKTFGGSIVRELNVRLLEGVLAEALAAKGEVIFYDLLFDNSMRRKRTSMTLCILLPVR